MEHILSENLQFVPKEMQTVFAATEKMEKNFEKAGVKLVKQQTNKPKQARIEMQQKWKHNRRIKTG